MDVIKFTLQKFYKSAPPFPTKKAGLSLRAGARGFSPATFIGK